MEYVVNVVYVLLIDAQIVWFIVFVFNSIFAMQAEKIRRRKKLKCRTEKLQS